MLTILIIYFVCVNILGFSISCWDKHVSKIEGHRRVPEKTFTFCGLIGGGIGVLTSFYLIRHKTQHKSLLAAVWICTVIGLGCVGSLVYLAVR